MPVEKVKPAEDPAARFTYVDISSIDNERHAITEPKVYYGSEAPSRARQLVQADDVLLSTVRTYLKNVALVPESCDGEIASTGFAVLRSGDAVLPRYLFHYALSDEFVSELTSLQRGTSYPAVREDDVRTRSIPLPPRREQRRIVEALETQFTRIDAAVAALKRAKATLRNYRASVLQAACEGRLVPTEAELARQEGRPYEPADELLQRILEARRAKWEEERWEHEIERAKKKAAQAERKAAGLPYYMRDLEPEHWEHRTPEEYELYLPKGDKWKDKYQEPEPPDTDGLPELPEGWCWASVEQVITRSQNGLGKRHSDTGHLTIVLRLADIEGGRCISLDHVRRIGMHKAEIEKYRLAENDLLCIRVNGSPDLVGRFVRFGSCDEAVAFCDHFIRFRFAIPQLNLFFRRYSHTRRARRYVDLNKVSSAGQNTISQSTMASLTFPLPPLAEQSRIVEELERRLSVVDVLEQSLEANLTRAERLRQAILKKAFEGRLVPQDPDDEPASVLLERITRSRKAAKPQRG